MNCFLKGSLENNSNASPLSGRLFVVIGAGGAGRALAYGAKEKGARVVIANRTLGKLSLHHFSHVFLLFYTIGRALLMAVIL